jgi:predicted AlkP superfamily phosphohydrolase/phosphomutase
MSLSPNPSVLVIGLDGLAPGLVFDRYLDELPTFRKLMEGGAWGELESVDPPITVPAWTCMMTGHSPRQLGLYGFRHRRLGTYDQRYTVNSSHVPVPRVWETLSHNGCSVGIIGVPQSHPISQLNGFGVGDFLCPDGRPTVYPPDLAAEIESAVGPYRPDVEGFRGLGADRALAQIRTQTLQHFKLLAHLIRTRPSHFLMMVELGSDRVHHLLFRHADRSHPRHDPRCTMADPVREYYRLLDDQLKEILERVPEHCHLFVVSDHGAKSMLGGFCINDWLIAQGMLRLRRSVRSMRRFDERMVDWSCTKAWAWGGHYGRVFINLEGREPSGIVPVSQYHETLESLRSALQGVVGPSGRPINNRVICLAGKGERDLPSGDYPDLMVYPGNLDFRAVGTVGNGTLLVQDNDTGPDDANHDFHGVLIYRGPRVIRGGHRTGLKLIDVGPTILDLFGLRAPDGAIGRVIEW